MPQTINYKFNISRESPRFEISRLVDNDTVPIIVVDNINNSMDGYKYTYNTDLPNSYKSVFSNIVENNSRIVTTNTLDILASDKMDSEGVYLYYKVLIKMPTFTSIRINGVEHSVVDSNFVYTNETFGEIEYIKNGTVIYRERIEVFPVYICRRNMHMANIIAMDNKYWDFNVRNHEISIRYSGTPNIKIGSPGSLFSSKINNKSLLMDGFYYKSSDDTSTSVYAYCDFIQDIRTVTDQHITQVKSGSISIGNSNIVPESIVLKLFRKDSDLYGRSGVELAKVTINEGAKFYTDEYIFTTTYASYGEDNPVEIYNIALPLGCLDRTNGVIKFDLPENLRGDDIYATVSYSYCKSLGISKRIEERNIVDVYIGPTSIITDGSIKSYDENIVVLYDDETFSFDNGLTSYVFDITDPIEADGEVILTEQNMIPVDSRYTSTDANGYGIGEYSPGIDFEFYQTAVAYTEYRMVYSQSMINIITAEKRKSEEQSVYVNRNIARPDLSKPILLKNYNFNSIHRYLESPVEIVNTAGIMYHESREGIFINGSEVSRDETYIYLEFDTLDIMSSIATVTGSNITADIEVLAYLDRFNLPGYTDDAVDYSMYSMFSVDENGTYTKITDVSVLMYNVDDEIVKVAMPISYAGSIVGLGLDAYTNPIIPKMMFKI